ncbi:uncharacterized protein LOC128500975 [Spea bombifrons]|uniref:uncharacterized protein LOC128500975 n=1 Tax=Spea bombifrons TaxID=233779 RepID=UPI00234B30F6|nr:uncharacterized protein LOC128500975 [Spea bombifrons]
MAHRILMEFQALEKYSQELLRKHAKKRDASRMQIMRSLKIPLAFDFESDDETDISLETLDITEDEGKMLRISPRSGAGLQKPHIDTSTKRELKPLRDSASTKCQHRAPKDLTGPKKRVKSAPPTSAARRRAWKSEVECIPNLVTLCQEEHKSPIAPPLGRRDNSHWSSLASPRLYSGSLAGTTDFQTPQNNVADDEDADMNPEQRPPRNETEIDSNLGIREKVIVSLSMEEEIKNPNVNILTARCRTPAKPVQIVSETVPVIFDRNHKSDFNRTRGRYPTGNPCPPEQPGDLWAPVGVKHFEQSSLNPVPSMLKNRQRTPPKASAEKKKKPSVLFSTNAKVNIHFLFADGTTQKPEHKDGKAGAARNLRSKYSTQEVQSSARSVITQEGVHAGDIGPLIIGVNPRKHSDGGPSPCPARPPPSRSTYPTASKPGSRRPLGVGEAAKWSFVSISKPLTPPVPTPNTPSHGAAAASSPAVNKDRPASSRKVKFGRFGSVSEDINPQPGVQGAEDGPDTEESSAKLTIRDSPRPAPDVTQHLDTEPDVSSDLSRPPSAFPVISIPTAPADASEQNQ